MAVYLLICAIVILACVLLYKISGKLGIPMLLAFILLGMFFGSDGFVRIPFDNYGFAEQVCSVALIFIMFYGGFGTSFRSARPVAAQSILLSSLGVILTAALVGVFCHAALKIDWLESFLIASVIGSTDAASVFSILRSRRLSLKYNTASLLELESGSNDPFSYMLTAIFISLMQGREIAGGIGYMVFAQLVYGGAAGVAIAFGSGWILKKIRFKSAGFDAVFVVAIAILSYALPAVFGGNGYLSAYIVGIILGNTDIPNKKTLVPFFDGVTGLMQILIFFLLGLLSFPSRLGQTALPALLIALFLTFVARPAAVFAILSPFKAPLGQKLLVSWAGLRGAASIVFAIMATMAVSTENDIFNIVLGVVLFSILLQGSLLPLISKKLGMIDDSDSVMKTFSDYSDEAPVEFIRFSIPQGHPWAGGALKDLVLPPETLIVMLIRNGEKLIPGGDTVIEAGDTVIMSARSPEKSDGVDLTEKHISRGDEYVGMSLAKIPREPGSLVILIMRGGRVIIPDGRTVLQEGDVLVINHAE